MGFCYYYVSQINSLVNNWIHYAVHCDVEQLSLWLLNYKGKVEFVLNEFFYINSSFTHLKLYGSVLNPTGAICWKKLKKLRLSYMKLDDELIQNILSGSHVLETLKLEYCYDFRRLNITSKSVTNLVFSGYWSHDQDESLSGDIIEINAPNILSLTIGADLRLQKILLLNVSSLVKAHLDYRYHSDARLYGTTEEEILKELILNLQHVRELKIGISCLRVFSCLQAEGFILPSNLKVPDVTQPVVIDED